MRKIKKRALDEKILKSDWSSNRYQKGGRRKNHLDIDLKNPHQHLQKAHLNKSQIIPLFTTSTPYLES